jgi:hypothetical protein
METEKKSKKVYKYNEKASLIQDHWLKLHHFPEETEIHIPVVSVLGES